MTDVMALSLLLKEEGSAALQSSLKKLGAEVALTVAQFGGLTKAITTMVRETADAQAMQAQLITTLESTNGVSGQTIETLNRQADALMKVTAFGDEAIRSAQAMLLGFTNVRTVFAETIPVVLDLAQKMQMDLSSAALLVGKALQSPLDAVGALGRAKIKLGKDEEDLIKKFIGLNDIAKAQRVVLDALRRAAGGSAEAYANTLGGALQQVKNEFLNLFEAEDKTSESMIRGLKGIAGMLSGLRPIIAYVFDNFVKGLVTVGTLIGQVTLAVARFFQMIGAVAINLGGAFATFLPGGVGEKVRQFLDTFNTDINASDANLSQLQERMADFRAQVLMGFATPQKKERGTGLGLPTDDVDTTGMTVDESMKQRLEDEKKAMEDFNKQWLEINQEFFNQRMQAQEDENRAFADALKEMDDQYYRDTAEAFKNRIEGLVAQMEGSAKNRLATGITESLEDGIASGLMGAIQSGRIDTLWKTMAQTLVGKIANVMVEFAIKTRVFATLMANIKRLLMLGNGAGAVLAAGALLAFAYANGGKSGVGSNTIAGGASGVTSTINAPIPTSRMVFNGTAAGATTHVAPIAPMNITVIGPNDPTAQRAMQELMMKANRRGNV